MVQAQQLFRFAVEEGIAQDPRNQDEIDYLLSKRQEEYDDLDGVRKDTFDEDRLENPFDDCKILHGKDAELDTVIVGVDVETQDLLLVNELNRGNANIDGVITHHPAGRAAANLHDVMKLQIENLRQAGIPVSQAEALIRESLEEVRQKLHPRNHPRTPQAAEHLNLPLMALHTVTDNHAYQYMKTYIADKDPRTLGDLLDALLEIPEYQWELEYGLGPELFAGSKENRVGNVGVLGFTGGTDPGEDLIENMQRAGIDTLVAMHATMEQVKQAEEKNINIVTAGHMSSDSLGINLFLDKAVDKFGIDVETFSGFKRVDRR